LLRKGTQVSIYRVCDCISVERKTDKEQTYQCGGCCANHYVEIMPTINRLGKCIHLLTLQIVYNNGLDIIFLEAIRRYGNIGGGHVR
jgi:hypothetical protein